MAVFQIGDNVRLRTLEDWFFKDIDADSVAFLKSCVGKTTQILGFDEYGHAELEFLRPAIDGDYRSHTVWIEQSWIEKA
ncbi:MAG: hypothetical protein B7Y80_04840 [Hyphomicrobium sp. 32-62-53]|nr:MAG: hypothetical protein B7Z29_05430 [Hyphomicrobium sp. 12-62-95]OYY01224.1 MAG: hypothetical protein B7Y80_04840 [Hyphomicrobium sp. 32-62-53]